MRKRSIWILFFVVFITSNALGQANPEKVESDSVELHMIETTDGNQYIGEIVHEDEKAVWLQTQGLGEIKLSRVYIRKIESLDQENLINDDYWPEHTQATRYFWGASGYSLKRGEALYQNVWIMLNQVSVGVTDHFTLGVGIVPAFLFAGSPTPVWITPKVSIPVVENKFNLGAGALAGYVIGEGNSGFGILYGLSTFGTRDKHLSFGLGYGLAGGSFTNLPVVTVSGMTRVGKNGYVLSENYFIPATPNLFLFSLGGKSVLKTIGLSYGLFIPIYEDLDTFFAIPWLGLTIPFGKKSNKK